ncbi:hypothetical protein EVAR_46932_1 [Eumeta japonica]|uniref:Uncharacterized protein n=1 Tax=Eumeta variegata TaxID=151549 RepID=A0A4C1ZWK6_EUMVA|nr:hypothetical protein EVAR_46932_1 [Eumeta japonica]
MHICVRARQTDLVETQGIRRSRSVPPLGKALLKRAVTGPRADADSMPRSLDLQTLKLDVENETERGPRPARIENAGVSLFRPFHYAADNQRGSALSALMTLRLTTTIKIQTARPPFRRKLTKHVVRP